MSSERPNTVEELYRRVAYSKGKANSLSFAEKLFLAVNFVDDGSPNHHHDLVGKVGIAWAENRCSLLINSDILAALLGIQVSSLARNLREHGFLLDTTHPKRSPDWLRRALGSAIDDSWIQVKQIDSLMTAATRFGELKAIPASCPVLSPPPNIKSVTFPSQQIPIKQIQSDLGGGREAKAILKWAWEIWREIPGCQPEPKRDLPMGNILFALIPRLRGAQEIRNNAIRAHIAHLLWVWDRPSHGQELAFLRPITFARFLGFVVRYWSKAGPLAVIEDIISPATSADNLTWAEWFLCPPDDFVSARWKAFQTASTACERAWERIGDPPARKFCVVESKSISNGFDCLCANDGEAGGISAVRVGTVIHRPDRTNVFEVTYVNPGGTAMVSVGPAIGSRSKA
jgi:hypothetical protein